MASGYEVAGTDLDSIFAPYHSGWPQAAVTGYEVAGTDLNARYAKLSSGSSASATGYKVAGADLNSIFAAYGSTGVIVATQPSNVSGAAAAGNPSGTVTSGAATCAFAGGKGSYTYRWYCTDCAANSPNSATTTFYATVDAGSTDNASAYCNGSDGTTSVNTDTIAVTLQNTTPASLYNGTMVAGYTSTGSGSDEVQTWGYTLQAGTGEPVQGSISPATDINGHTVFSAYSTMTGTQADPSSRAYVLNIEADVELGQSYISSATIGSATLAASSASYTWTSEYNLNQWIWEGAIDEFVDGDSYPVSYV